MDKLTKLNKEDTESCILENWEVNDLDEIKKIDSGEDDDEEAEVSNELSFSFSVFYLKNCLIIEKETRIFSPNF